MLIACLLIFLFDIKYKQWKNQRAVERQQQELTAQINLLTKKNSGLNQSMSYLNSLSFKERVAREQLNLKKAGELAYTFTQAPTPSSTPVVTTDSKSNFEKWVDYFTQNN